MARINNAITFGSGFNIASIGPIDSRMLVEYESDLTDSSNWPSDKAPRFNGMTVTVMETGDVWVLKDVNNANNLNLGWKKVGGSTIKEVIISDSGSAETVTLSSNTLYTFTTRTSDLTLSLGTPTSGIVNEYHLTITIGSTKPTINWPSGLSWYGDGSEPSISTNKTYEVSILNNIAVYIEI